MRPWCRVSIFPFLELPSAASTNVKCSSFSAQFYFQNRITEARHC